MEFSGTFELDNVTIEAVWLALSDPVLLAQAAPGCEFARRIDDPGDVDFDELREEAAASADPPTLPEADPNDVAARGVQEGEHYAAVLGVSVGSVNPTFEAIATIAEREFPEMHAEAEGASSNSSFEVRSGMRLTEVEGGVQVEWWGESDVFGRVAQLGQRVMNPVANRLVNRFFSGIADRLDEMSEEEAEAIRATIEENA